MVSAIGAGRPEESSEQMRPYIEAKAHADAALERSGLDFTIVRPGGLTDERGTGQVSVDGGYGEIPREDVAAVLVAVLDDDGTIGKTFELVGGDTPIEEALKVL
jgi:uncharacterized protein YbjT (DUF2867 family)